MFGLFNGTKKYENIGSAEMQKIMGEDKNAIVLDVRTKDEFKSGHIPGAKNIDIFSPTFSTEIDMLDKTKTYLVYCRSGNRSGSACGAMASKGFDKLYNLSGGIGAWQGPVK
ncbi:rhodanese-like domain-containing protein [Cytophagales bacterium LB-30]|uniref:Rhodanese-like domain-containing protein n=1 Tax=Shiella aurantiaca TaxID=3058365 RepID=A0ABT8F2X7_9BACT|nr:rhodanese-like domain-containing protein [Shiella aurantiaca]MDN4164812.1 rhodanese-like domain-containing protein [Shiella aurantiaca]